MSVGFFDVESCDLNVFRDVVSQTCAPQDVPHADRIEKNIPIYAVSTLSASLEAPDTRTALLAEWARVLGQGAGVLVIQEAVPDAEMLDSATEVFEQIIAREKAAGTAQADHFAKAGANDRIWNAAQKLCEADPALFARYFGNPFLAAVCEAWLGPFYQMTAQVNLVRPGGAAQEAHRDYHLGFQTAQVAGRFPAHAHDLSAAMTLQGGIAHCDVPIDSGPTKLLPFSQLYRPGYMAYRRPDFRKFFEEACVQLPLSKGDAIFFNPALFHAAGENRSSDIQRMVNLLQVSSAFGRAMETLDRDRMCRLLYPALSRMHAAGQISVAEVDAAIAAAAEGYSFPTNLDTDPPTGGLAPETQAALFRRALDAGMTPDVFEAELTKQAARRAA